MRIAQLAPFAESVPPKLYGGTERVVAWLVDELVELATMSRSSRAATPGPGATPFGLATGASARRKGADPNAACAFLLEAIAKRAADFDVIHSHVDWLALPLLSRLGVPFLTTMHGRLDLPGLPDVIREFWEAGLVSISDNQRRPLPRRTGSRRSSTGCPLICFGRPRTRILSGVSGAPDCGEGAGRRHPHRASCRNAAAHRRQDTARRDRLLQEVGSSLSSMARDNSSAKSTTRGSSRS